MNIVFDRQYKVKAQYITFIFQLFHQCMNFSCGCVIEVHLWTWNPLAILSEDQYELHVVLHLESDPMIEKERIPFYLTLGSERFFQFSVSICRWRTSSVGTYGRGELNSQL